MKDTFEKLHNVYGKDCMSHMQVCKWFKYFKDVHESSEVDESRGRLVTSNTDHNVELVNAAVKKTAETSFMR